MHVIAGPVNAATMLTEARWVVETWKMALLEKKEDLPQLSAFFAKAHADRLWQEHGLRLSEFRQLPNTSSAELSALLDEPANRKLTRQGRVHLLLASDSPLQIEQIYKVVFEEILAERISTNPVVSGNPSPTRALPHP